MNQKKRGLSILLAALMLSSVLTGCKTKVDEYSTTVVATYGEENIYMDEAYFYAKLTQFQYEIYYSTELWSYDFTGTGETFEDSVREDVMSQIYQTYILNDEAAEMGIELSEDQKKLVAENVEEFMKTEDLVAATRATKEMVEKVYTMNALANLVYEELVADTDREVDEEKYASKNISYIVVRSSDSEKKEKEELEAVADEVYKKVVKGDKFSDIVKAYDSDDYTVSSSEDVSIQEEGSYLFQKEAWKMKTDEVIKTYIKDRGYWYVIKCNDDDDTEAQDKAIEKEIESREAKTFEKKYKDILKDAKVFDVDEKKWAEIKYVGDPAYIPETEDEKETKTEEASSTEESSSAEESSSVEETK